MVFDSYRASMPDKDMGESSHDEPTKVYYCIHLGVRYLFTSKDCPHCGKPGKEKVNADEDQKHVEGEAVEG